jgi:hypothetical protein
MPSEELQGEELYESVTGAALVRKEQRCTNRCEYCWHDLTQRCMCHHARPHSLHTTVNVKVLVLMHSKEYLNPGTDAKLLLAMLPPERAKLYARLPPSNPARGRRAHPEPCQNRCHAPLWCSSDARPCHLHDNLPPTQVYGRPGDLAALRDELAIAPRHTLLLWPGEGALTAVPHVESVGCVVPPLATTASVGQ